MIIPVADRLGDVQEYYFSKKLNEIRQLNAEGKDIINLAIGSPDLPPSEETVDALVETAKSPNAHGYQSYTGIPELREEISNWVKNTYNVALDPGNEILPLVGSKEGIMHISMAFVNPGDKVLIPNPGYPAYASVCKLVQAETLTYNLSENNGWQIDLNHLQKLDLDSVKLMWINYPNMPTGADMDKEHLSKLIALAKKHSFLIINDNPYSLILNKNPQSILSIPGAKEVCLELNSLSKSHNMAGWRIGWLSGDSEYLSNVLRVKSNMDSGMFLGIQNAAIQALKNPKEWHNSLNNSYATRRRMIEEIYDFLGVQFEKDIVGMFVWGKIPAQYKNAAELVDKLLYESKVFITPGFIFGSNGDQYIRASLCGKEDRIKEAFERIKNTFSK
jgi:hypothetical protein